MKTILILLVAALLTSCATAPSIDTMTPDRIRNGSKAERDDFKKLTSVSSIWIFHGKGDRIVNFQKMQLHAEYKDGSERVNYFVLLQTQRGYGQSWAFWKEVYDQNGVRFSLNREASEVQGGIVTELCSIPVTRDYLEKLRTSPVVWKVYGERAEDMFTIQTNLAAGFLAKCDERFGPPVKR